MKIKKTKTSAATDPVVQTVEPQLVFIIFVKGLVAGILY